MANSWDSAASMAERHAASGGMFVRLAKDGDKVVGAFCGEPLPKEVVWTGERYETYDEQAHGDKRPSLRVMVNFFVPADGQMKVIEGGAAWFKDILKVRDKYGLDTWLFEIERHGDAGDTKTTYSILPETKIDDEMRAKIAAVDLIDLEVVGSGKQVEKKPARRGTSAPASKAPSDGTIDAEVAGELVALLKSLPRPDVEAFLKKYGVQRVRDLDADQEISARTFIETLVAKQQGGTEEVDPFA